jgi:hypothetical protein
LDNGKNRSVWRKNMNKRRTAGIFAVLLMATALIAACTQAPAPGPGNAVITYRLYGGFVMPEYAIQELVVTKDVARFTIQSFDGNITGQSEKNLTLEQYNGIVRVFTDNNFPSYGDRYDEGQNYVTDVGFADITFAENGKSKTVTTYNVNDYMPAGLIEIRRKLQETVEFTRTLDGNQRKALAESWIRKAPTYAYDGSGLVFVSDVPAGSDPVAHNLTYTFTSSHAGYGNRTGAVTDQVITEHSITLTLTYDGIVQSAVIDGTWDEIGQYLIGSEVSLHYQPMQCEKMPWQVWEENSGRVYIRAPTEEEIITHYYQAVYDIGVGKVQKLEPGIATCQACSVCPETYRFVLTVDADRMHVLLDEGWMRG